MLAFELGARDFPAELVFQLEIRRFVSDSGHDRSPLFASEHDALGSVGYLLSANACATQQSVGGTTRYSGIQIAEENERSQGSFAMKLSFSFFDARGNVDPKHNPSLDRS